MHLSQRKLPERNLRIVYLNEQLPVFIITRHEMVHVGLKFIKETETTYSNHGHRI